MAKSSKTVNIKKSHLKEDKKSFKEIKEETHDINKELKKLTSRDKSVKKR